MGLQMTHILVFASKRNEGGNIWGIRGPHLYYYMVAMSMSFISQHFAPLTYKIEELQ